MASTIASPLLKAANDKSRRHERIFSRLLAQLAINSRAGFKPTFHHAVLLHPKALIHRPDAKAFDTRNVIKADQIGTWRNAYVDKNMTGMTLLNALVNLNSMDSVRAMAEKLMRQHRPTNPLDLPEWMKPKASALTPTPKPTPAATPAAARAAAPQPAGARPAPVAPAPAPHAAPAVALVAAAPDESLKRKLVCVTCGQKISFGEGKFCWNQEGRFGGFQYCREHQAVGAG
ncbi:hypothetical protein [Ideonella livida]|uniref:Uncharacterized protein n=1 Tax=Ideonella livida TaxID=2707176 RepID=A0A7C9PG52_9BURK|nr:hypothetical protein [Ideonella livida]NDY91056.1 hypothetical protein [Ideonella livida]